MTLLFLGLVLWTFCHSLKRIFPAGRNKLDMIAGVNGSKGILAIGVIISLVLIVIGYRNSNYVLLYNLPNLTLYITNLLMLVAIGLIGLMGGKSRLRRYVRHPMLSSVIAWAVAHLAVNGDSSSVITFGTLGLWAGILITMINSTEATTTNLKNLSLAGDIRWGIITLVVFGIISYIHLLLGYSPFSS